jgi:hypothetical protein
VLNWKACGRKKFENIGLRRIFGPKRSYLTEIRKNLLVKELRNFRSPQLILGWSNDGECDGSDTQYVWGDENTYMLSIELVNLTGRYH